MFCLVTATIVMHNMMVKVRVSNEEMGNESFYDIGDCHFEQTSLEEEVVGSEGSVESSVNMAVGQFDMSNVCDSIMKYSIIQRRWNKLYSEETSLKLQDAVKKYIFKTHFGDDGTLDMNEFTEDYDPLTF